MPLNNDVKLLALHEDLLQRLSVVSTSVETISLTPGPQGDKGDKGDKGEPGDDGKDGIDGTDGVDGVDGEDGADGVSVVDAEIAADDHLVLTLSDGNIIDAGAMPVGKDGDGTVIYNVSGGGSFNNNTSPELGGYLDLNDRGMVSTFTAAEALTAGDVCILNSSGEMAKANATSSSTCSTLIAMAVKDIANGDPGKFLLRGFYDMSGFGTGDLLYVDVVSGATTDFAPTATGQIVRVLGYAISPSQIFFDPDKTWIELA